MLPSGESFVEAMHTQRLDGGMVSRWRLNDGIVLGGRFSSLTRILIAFLATSAGFASTQRAPCTARKP